jgi:hypothetical protein
LYQADESHPSVFGTYAGACAFYASIFRKDPALCTFNSVLSSTDADNIKNAASAVVFDSLLEWHIGEYDSLFVNCTGTGLPEYGSSSWNVYPNPADESLLIDTRGKAVNHVKLYNSTGRVIWERELHNESNIDISKIASGLYFLQINKSEKGIKFLKH